MIIRKYLWLHCVLFGAVSFEPCSVDLTVKVANVANDGIFFECKEMLSSDDIFATSRGDYQVSEVSAIVHSIDLYCKTVNRYFNDENLPGSLP